MKFFSKNDALDYMSKLKTDVTNQYIKDYNDILSNSSNMYSKPSIKRLILDVVGELKQQKYEHFQICHKWITCGRKIFSYSEYGLAEISDMKTKYALMHIICKELEKVSIIYYIKNNLILRVNGDKEYWQSQAINGDFGNWDWHTISMRHYCDVYLKQPIKGSLFIKERLDIQKKYCSITECKKVYPSAIDTYKKEKFLAAYNSGIFSLGGVYILNDCSLEYWMGDIGLTLTRGDMFEKPLEKWV